LPTNQEWLQAALGTPDKFAGWGLDDCQVDNNWGEQPGPAGSGDNCISAVGAFDMIGNVWEWVQGAVNDGRLGAKQLPASGYIDSLDGESLPGITNPNAPNAEYNHDYFWLKDKGLRGIVRGGYWNNQSEAGQYSVYMVAPPSSGEAGIGFRCAL
jgi:formylglycine-generating enzyme required for sulfatase activity